MFKSVLNTISLTLYHIRLTHMLIEEKHQLFCNSVELRLLLFAYTLNATCFLFQPDIEKRPE